MAATAQQEYQAKCDRMTALRSDLKKRQEEAEILGKFTPEGKTKFDELAAEFTTLKTAVLAADHVTQAKQFLHECDVALDSPRRLPVSPEEIEADLASQRNDILMGRGGQLRHFCLHGPNNVPQNLAKNRKSALLAGLILLRQTKLHQDWANPKSATGTRPTAATRTPHLCTAAVNFIWHAWAAVGLIRRHARLCLVARRITAARRRST